MADHASRSPHGRTSRSPSRDVAETNATTSPRQGATSEPQDEGGEEEARRRRSRSPARDAAATRETDRGKPGTNLYVANLASRVGQVDLHELFATFGRVDKCEVIVDPVTRASRGFGFVTFADVRDAEDAVKELNDQDVQGRKIRVEHAKRKRGHEKTPGQYLGPRLASAKYGGRDRFSRDRSRDRGRRSRSRDRGGFSRRYDDRERGRHDARDRGRGRYDERDRGRRSYDRDTQDDRRRR